MKLNLLKLRAERKDARRDVLVSRLGREQIKALVKKGLSVPVVML